MGGTFDLDFSFFIIGIYFGNFLKFLIYNYSILIMKFKKMFNKVGFFPLFIIPTIFVSSCSAKSEAKSEIDILSDQLIDDFTPWYKSLTNSQWNKNSDGTFQNAYCESEQQALTLNANNWGNFWNSYLHQKLTPPPLRFKDENICLMVKN